jgi:hypothetical protein
MGGMSEAKAAGGDSLKLGGGSDKKKRMTSSQKTYWPSLLLIAKRS